MVQDNSVCVKFTLTKKARETLAKQRRLRLSDAGKMLRDDGWKFDTNDRGVWGYEKPGRYAVINFDPEEQDEVGVSINPSRDLLEISLDYADEVLIQDALDMMM